MSALNYLERTAEPTADDAERRVAPRTKILKRGQVLFNNNFSTFDCIVRNISATGALLTLDESAHLPKEFSLRIGEERAVRPARLVYRRGALAGIRFIDVAPHEEEPSLSFASEPSAVAAPEFPAVTVEGTIRKLQGERLPVAVSRHFRWFETRAAEDLPMDAAQLRSRLQAFAKTH